MKKRQDAQGEGRTRPRWEQQVTKDVMQRERNTQEEVRGQEVCEHGDGQTWLLDNPHNMEMCAEDEAMAIIEKSAKLNFSSV